MNKKTTRMKLEKEQGLWYLYFGEDNFIHTLNDWNQLWGNYNWYSFHFIRVYFENDVMTGGWEFEFAVLGLGFRLRWNYALEESVVGKRLK